MPIYEYQCSTCDERVEVLIGASAGTPSGPGCGDPLTHKLFSTAYVISGRTRQPRDQACCGNHKQCDGSACTCEGECGHG